MIPCNNNQVKMTHLYQGSYNKWKYSSYKLCCLHKSIPNQTCSLCHEQMYVFNLLVVVDSRMSTHGLYLILVLIHKNILILVCVDQLNFLFSFQKQPTTLEELERIDNEIQSLQRLRRRDGELETQYVGTLFLYSVIIYIIMALVFYFYFIPEDWTGRVIQISPFLLFPFL